MRGHWGLALVVLLACGGGTEKPKGSRGTSRSAGAGKISVVATEAPGSVAADAHGSIAGLVVLDGEAPKRAPLTPLANTAGCHERGEDLPLDERWVIDPEGHLANVVIRLLRAPDPPVAQGRPVRIDQRGCLFVPHVVALQAGGAIEVANSDSISHNVRLSADRNSGGNETIGPGGKAVLFQLPEAESCELACDIHPWMKGYVVVVEHPWFAVSTADGSFTIGDVPPGTYGLEAWHEELGRLRLQKIEVAPGGSTEVEVVFRP